MKNRDVVKYRITIPYVYYETGEISVPNGIPEEDVGDLILKALQSNINFRNYFEAYDEGIDESRFEVDAVLNKNSPDSEVFGILLKIENGEPKLENIYNKEIN